MFFITIVPAMISPVAIVSIMAIALIFIAVKFSQAEAEKEEKRKREHEAHVRYCKHQALIAEGINPEAYELAERQKLEDDARFKYLSGY